MNTGKSNMVKQFPTNFNFQDGLNVLQRTPFPFPPMSYVLKYSNTAVANGTTPGPPPLPTNTSIFVSFNEPYFKDDQVLRSLESQGQHRLYPQVYYLI